MSESAENITESGSAETVEDNYTPPASQAELDRIIQNRIARTEAKYADYSDLKAAKAELDEIRAASQTEQEKVAAELDKLRADLADRDAKLAAAELQSIKSEVAATKGVPSANLTGTTREEIEASADALAAWRDGQSKKNTAPKGPLKSGAGRTGVDSVGSAKERAARALRGE